MSLFKKLKLSPPLKENAKPGTLASAQQKTQKLVTDHFPTLINLRGKGIKYDAYGDVDSSAWNKSIQIFFDRVVKPKLTEDELYAIRRYDPSKFAQVNIENVIRSKAGQDQLKASINQKKLIKSIQQFSPAEYETYCASLIARQGWSANTTATTGDQGADIIATKRSDTLVVQCKLYSTKVGNDAVQQVIAARAYYKANFAAVITNSTYTKSAIELAKSSCVILLNHSEIDELDLRLKLVKV